MDKPKNDLDVMRVSKSMMNGMQMAITSWPKVLTPDQVVAQAEQDYVTMFTQHPNLTQLMTRDQWTEYSLRGYAWQSARLMDMWGYNNFKLAATLLAGEE